MAAKTAIILLVTLIATAATAQECDLVGEWRAFEGNTYANEAVGGTIEYDFTSNDTVSFTSVVVVGDDCKIGQTRSGTYTFTNGTYLAINVTDCEYVNCASDCTAFCYVPCTFSGVLETEVNFAGDCNSFTTSSSSLTFWREGAYWWIWFILALLILGSCCCCCCCCVACVVGCCVGGVKLLTPSQTGTIQVDLEQAPHVNYGATHNMY